MPSSRFALTPAIAVALFVVGSCADSPSSPARLPSGAVAGLSAKTHDEEHVPNGHAYGLVKCDGRGPRTGAAVIGPAGGVLHVGPNALIVPAGALEATVAITARVADTVAAIEFEPHGLRFDRPVLLILDTRGCDVRAEQRPVLLYLDDDGEARETINGNQNDHKHRFSAPIVHFSVYAIGV